MTLHDRITALADEWVTAAERPHGSEWDERYADAVTDCGTRLRAVLAETTTTQPEAPSVTIVAWGATPEQAERLFDAAVDTAHDHAAPGVTVDAVATLRPEACVPAPFGCGWCDDGRDVTHPNCDHATAQPEADAVERVISEFRECVRYERDGTSVLVPVADLRVAYRALAAAQPVQPVGIASDTGHLCTMCGITHSRAAQPVEPAWCSFPGCENANAWHDHARESVAHGDARDEFSWHETNGPVIDDDRYMPVTIARRLAAAQPVECTRRHLVPVDESRDEWGDAAAQPEACVPAPFGVAYRALAAQGIETIIYKQVKEES